MRILSLALLVVVSVQPAWANTIFNVSAVFDDKNATPLVGTITLDSVTGALDGFNFDIPAMTIGSTTLPGAAFTPQTATPDVSSFGPGTFVTFQLFNAPPEGDELFLLIPTPSLPYSGGPLLQVLNFQGTDFHTGFQSGVQANPFFEIVSNGSITLATPEPTAILPLGACFVALMGAALVRKKRFV